MHSLWNLNTSYVSIQSVENLCEPTWKIDLNTSYVSIQ